MLEHHARRKGQTQRVFQLLRDQNGKQRMAAESEEVVVEPDTLDAQSGRKRRGNFLFDEALRFA